MDDKRLSDDLIIGLIFRADSVLYIRTGTKKNFPDFKMAHGTTDAQKIGRVRQHIHDQLGLTASSVELLGHIQKNPNDIMQYFINAHIYIYKITIPPHQFITPPLGAAEIGWHDLHAGQEEGFSYKGKLMLDFLRDWTIPDLARLDARDIRDWYNKWLGRHLRSAYQEFIDEDIDQCRAEAECFSTQVGSIVRETLPELPAGTDDRGEAVPRDPLRSPGPPLPALRAIRDHLCGRLYGLKGSQLNDLEMRIAYRVIGHFLKRTNALLDTFGSDGATPGFGLAFHTLISELESESLSPFETRRT